MKILMWLLLVSTLGNSWVEADHRMLQPDNDSYLVDSTGMNVPINKIVLIKEHDKMGAFKFIKYSKADAEYEWYFPLGDSMKQGKRKLKDRYWTLIGRISFQLGDTTLNCGSLNLEWTESNTVCFFYDNESIVTKSIQLAPTNKENISEIDVNDPKLKWYGYDENREVFRIRLEDLLGEL